MLVQQQHVPHSYSNVDMHPNPNSWNAHVYGILWPIYKLLRLLSISSSVLYPNTNYSSQTESSILKTKSNDPTANIDKEALRKPQDASIQNEALETKDHNKHQSIWRIYGKEYDLSNFVRDHPGGYEAIMLGCNRDDCTALFRSYHPSPLSYHRAAKVLQSYRIPTNTNNYNDNNHSNPGQGNELATSSSPTTEKAPDSKCWNDLDATHVEDDHVDEFYDLLCERVAKELWDRHRYHILKDRTATPMRVAYYVFVTFGVFVSAYNYGIRGSHILFGSIPFAVFGWLFGALGHDAGHYTVCRTYPIVNDVCVWAMCLLCNPIVWQHQHTYGHHSHTNDVEHDPDLHHFTTLLRVHEKFQYYGIYRYQKHPLYVFFSYTFVVFGTCIWIPWGIIQEGSLYGIVEWTDRHRPWRATGMYAHLIAYTIFIIIVPFFVYKHWYMAWLAVTTHISLSGIIFAIFSQINHLNEPSLQRTSNAENNKLDTGDESVDKPKIQKIKDSWSVRQIEASNNFCPQSVLWYILSNGLNLQIEHHLFPGINHCHLPKIQSIVRDVCREYGVPYKCYDSWYDIMKATLDWLNRLSEKHLAMVRPGPNIGSCQ